MATMTEQVQAYLDNYAAKDESGTPVIETTWHHIVAQEDKDLPIFDLAHLSKGDEVHVIGRLQIHKYADSLGEEHDFMRVIASHIAKIAD